MEMNDNILNMETDVIVEAIGVDNAGANNVGTGNVGAKNFSPLPKNISIQEHAYIPEDYLEQLQNVNFVGTPSDYMGTPKFLGIGQDFRASYYIGASWLIKNEMAVVVTPKFENVDFIRMFISALEVDTRFESDYFSKCYGINFDEPTIAPEVNQVPLTPMLVLHYISLLGRLVKRGLKKDYITREENLKAKVKGRIMMGRHLQQNVFQQRDDRVFCQYQEHTDDTPENRLLKRALLFAERVINNYGSLKKQLEKTDVPRQISTLKAKFAHISDDIEPYQIQHLSANKLYKDYREAIRVAKMLLRRFDYSISAVSEETQPTSPFWIDMARLYEMWVLNKLNTAFPGQIEFQVDGHCRTKVDYIKKDEKIIMDAKYKPRYENSNCGILDDIREISGYARDRKILKRLKADEQEIKCVIIYPKPINFESDETDLDADTICKETDSFDKGELIPQCSEIKWFRNFYKISVPLPKL